ncbi:MAG: fibronectin type III domain-containing protein [Candidatus Coatesbacteria bacterium]|nr:MAG: fibronectin type III domain-containing protein [Candidatus Coatesbacteria bacterium]
MRKLVVICVVITGALLISGCQEIDTEVSAVTVMDAPNDSGGGVVVAWPAPAGVKVDSFAIERLDPETGKYTPLTTVKGDETFLEDTGLTPNADYSYRVVANLADGKTTAVGEGAGRPTGEWFNFNRLNVLVGVVSFVVLVLVFISMARGGKELFVRKIAGLEAVDEAIGRATEMGKPILFVSGLGDASDIATIAAMTILAKVARKTAEYETPLIVPCRDPIVMMVEKEMVREAYTEVGRPDAFEEDSVFYVTDSQFGYVAAVDGIMLRERPATNFYMGAFYAESLILAETGAQTGAIQIAGTDRVTQFPFFITACDYTLMGEELYAATAYLGRDPLMLGSLKGQDWAKAVILVILIVGAILIALTGLGEVDTTWFARLFETVS